MSDRLVQTTAGIGRTEKDTRVYLDYVERFVITPALLTAGVYRLPLEAGALVVAVRAAVAEAFNGTTPTAKIGDAADDDGYLAAADTALATPGSAANSLAKANAYSGGRHYAASSMLVVTIAGAPTAGALIVEVVRSGYPANAPSYLIANR